MRKCICVLVVLIGLLFNGVVEAADADWRFPVGLTYFTGLGDVVDNFKENTGITASEDYAIPIGLAFTPYVQLENGVRIGAGIGPSQLILYSDSAGNDLDFYNIPVNMNVGYTFLPSSSTSLYVYGGIAYPIADGDFVMDTNAGFTGALGVEFKRQSAVGFGLEIAYDASEIEFEKRITSTSEKIKPTATMIRGFAVF